MQYRRMLVSGTSYFFTVNLYDRRRTLLVDEINQLKFSLKKVNVKYPFLINAIVVLPEHLHTIRNAGI